MDGATVATIYKVVKECFTEKVTFELTPEGDKRTSHVDFRGKCAAKQGEYVWHCLRSINESSKGASRRR